MNHTSKQWQSRILALLNNADRPKSAYDLLEQLRVNHGRIAPPTVYRALAKLTESGEIHRLESLNAFIACQCTAHHKASVLSICDDCGIVEESLAPDLLNKLSNITKRSGFVPSHHVIEVHGRCASCGVSGNTA